MTAAAAPKARQAFESFTCSRCFSVITEDNKDAQQLGCELHSACSTGCASVPCRLCVCDRCAQVIPQDREYCSCDCQYHRDCLPDGVKDGHYPYGCGWCEPVSVHSDVMRRRAQLKDSPAVQEVKERTYADVYLSEAKMVAHGWKLKHLLERKHYRGSAVLAAGIPYKDWSKYDLGVAAFAQLEVDPEDLIKLYFLEMNGEDFDAVQKNFPRLGFTQALLACSVPVKVKYGTKTQGNAHLFLEMQARGVFVQTLANFLPKEEELKYFATREHWDKVFPGVYSELFPLQS